MFSAFLASLVRTMKFLYIALIRNLSAQFEQTGYFSSLGLISVFGPTQSFDSISTKRSGFGMKTMDDDGSTVPTDHGDESVRPRSTAFGTSGPATVRRRPSQWALKLKLCKGIETSMPGLSVLSRPI